ncbi:MAG: hypothetical protein HC880_00470 [Bacteroidia bacterium]|nr:hypothetical protein [Bacteroidia bacterium]
MADLSKEKFEELKDDIKELGDRITTNTKEINNTRLAFKDTVNDTTLAIFSDIKDLKNGQKAMKEKYEEAMNELSEVLKILRGSNDGKIGVAQKINMLWNTSVLIFTTGAIALINAISDFGGWLKHIINK